MNEGFYKLNIGLRKKTTLNISFILCVFALLLLLVSPPSPPECRKLTLKLSLVSISNNKLMEVPFGFFCYLLFPDKCILNKIVFCNTSSKEILSIVLMKLYRRLNFRKKIFWITRISSYFIFYREILQKYLNVFFNFKTSLTLTIL